MPSRDRTEANGPTEGERRPNRTWPDSALAGGRARRSRAERRIGVALLAVLVGLALAGVLGERTSVLSVDGGGYHLSVTYPSVVRPGNDVRWDVSVAAPAGLGKSLSLAFSRRYFDLFDLNGIRPDPDSVTSSGDGVVYTWDAPPGRSFVVSIDAYAEYGEHFGLDGFTSVVVEGRAVVTARYHTRWVP